MAQVVVAGTSGWGTARTEGRDVYFKGYLLDGQKALEGASAVAHVAGALPRLDDPEVVSRWVAELDGMFALIVHEGAKVFGAVDRNRTIPLLYTQGGNGFVIGDNGPAVADAMGVASFSKERCLELGMAGYLSGDGVLADSMAQLRAGECVLHNAGATQTKRYYVYSPWQAPSDGDRESYAARLSSLNESLFTKLAKELAGRTVMAPLSAGLDSRLVVSGLVEAGHTNIRCFAYGLAGNFEAKASRAIAKKLDLPWEFIPFSPARQKRVSQSTELAEYLRQADTYTGVPTTQDFLAIRDLHRFGSVPEDAVFINGNSGDFISGGHVPAALASLPAEPVADALRRVHPGFMAKHYSLWDALKTPENIELAAAWLRKVWDASAPGMEQVPAWAVHECLEWQGRQTTFVITLQRVYEYFGYGWRLPLWDKDYLDFWETVPARFKVGQNLYKEVLTADNWGGVWRDMPAASYVSPAWVRPFRLLGKVACLPFGRSAWHRLEKRAFAYWMDNLCSASVFGVPYSRFLFEKRGFRNGIAFRVEKYLQEKGCELFTQGGGA